MSGGHRYERSFDDFALDFAAGGISCDLQEQYCTTYPSPPFALPALANLASKGQFFFANSF